jgi:hypothetical protein
MTVEQMVAALEEQGWRIWNLQQGTRGAWSCRLYEADLGSRLTGKPGPTGFDLECWRHGTGPTMPAAIGAAAAGLFGNHQPPMEEALDLAAMLS